MRISPLFRSRASSSHGRSHQLGAAPAGFMLSRSHAAIASASPATKAASYTARQAAGCSEVVASSSV
eukprot:927126-Prymnesium_polylepis.2